MLFIYALAVVVVAFLLFLSHFNSDYFIWLYVSLSRLLMPFAEYLPANDHKMHRRMFKSHIQIE